MGAAAAAFHRTGSGAHTSMRCVSFLYAPAGVAFSDGRQWRIKFFRAYFRGTASSCNTLSSSPFCRCHCCCCYCLRYCRHRLFPSLDLCLSSVGTFLIILLHIYIRLYSSPWPSPSHASCLPDFFSQPSLFDGFIFAGAHLPRFCETAQICIKCFSCSSSSGIFYLSFSLLVR